MKTFADDTKIALVVDNPVVCQILQDQINRLIAWSIAWQMSFNTDKCTVMHLGHKNMSHVYYLGEKALDSTDYEKDIGVYMHSSLKPSLQVAESVKKANRALGQLLKCVTYQDKVHYIRLYKQYVRCHLEFACQAWNPWLNQDIDLLEGVQKRAIKRCYGLEGSYEDKLKQVGLTTLYERRIRGDINNCTTSVN